MQAIMNTWLAWVVAVLVVISLLFSYGAYGAANNIDIPDVDTSYKGPTAEQIAGLINIPTPKDSINNQLINDILEGVYPDEVEELEEDCIDDLDDEFRDDALDDIEDLIEANENEPIENLEVIDWNFDDDYRFNVVNLGLDDEEDRAGELSVTFQVEYNLEDGDQEDLRDKVYVTASCGDYDSDDNEFDDLEVDYSLNR